MHACTDPTAATMHSHHPESVKITFGRSSFPPLVPLPHTLYEEGCHLPPLAPSSSLCCRRLSSRAYDQYVGAQADA